MDTEPLHTGVFVETDEEKADALMYTAVFDEILRLKTCRSYRERQRIRDFILAGYQELKEHRRENVNPIILPDNAQQQM